MSFWGGPLAFRSPFLYGKRTTAVGVADVEPLRIRPERIEGDAEGLREPGGVDADFFGLAAGVDAAEDADLAGIRLAVDFAVGDKQVSVGSEADEAGFVHAGSVLLDLETRRGFGPGVGWFRN